MNQEDLFKKIGLILNELNVQYEFLAQSPQQLNELELALFHANADFLSDHAQILIKVSNNSAPPLEIQAAHEPIQKINQPTVEDRLKELESDPTSSTFEFVLNESPQQNGFITDENKLYTNEKFEFEEKSVDELFNRPLSQEEENILAQKRKLSEIVIEEPVDADEDEIGPEPFLVSKTVKEEFLIDEEDLALETAIEPVINTQQSAVEDPGYKPTVNDLLAAKTDKSVNDASGLPKLSDLKQGINLNDKLLYIKDLFNGYNLAYAEAIDLANKLPNFEAADNFFKKNYADKNNWAEKQATVDKFYKLLHQRFK